MAAHEIQKEFDKSSKTKASGLRPLDGKVAIVTGSSSGIGEAIARALAENGAKVALAARRKDRLDQLKNEIVKLGGVAVSIVTDVVSRKEVVELLTKTNQKLGPVDILVNNAGIGFYETMKNCNLDEWEKMVDVNCKGVMNCIAAVLPGMLERKQGHIINISSNAGRKVYSPGLTVYSATKYFVEALTQGLRLEIVGSRVKVTSIQPGDVTTEFGIESADKEAQKKYGVSDDVKILEPRDIASAVMYSVTQPPHCSVNEVMVEPMDAPF